MRKIKQFANNAFRPDRTEVLTESLQEAERRIDQIKATCESLAKKVHDCLQVKGKDAVIEKRIRKVPEFLLGSAMINNGKSLGDGSILGEVLAESGQIQMKLGQEVVKYEVQIEESILRPLQTLMEHDLPSIYKLKRQLAKYTADMDIAKAKLSQVNRHSSALPSSGPPSTPTGGGSNKADSLREEYDEALGKMEQCRDNLAAEMYTLIARESEISRLIVDFLNYQKDYHSSVTAILSELISNVEGVVASSFHKPVYGLGLEEHLSSSGRRIAYPLELCVCALLETGLEEEGLFRIAGSTSKVKKLKAAFDATLVDLEGLLSEFCDVHVIANALKCYLRELPEPLLTFGLYNDWMGAIRVQDSNLRQEGLRRVLEKLPRGQKENLTYLVKFLKELSSRADINKMSPANIAIVIAPNLLWSPPPTGGATEGDLMGDNSQMGLNMTMTHLYSSLLEQLVSNCNYFFPEEIDFFVTCAKPMTTSGSSDTLAVDGSKGHQNCGLVNGSSIDEHSSTDNKLTLQRSVSNSSMDYFDEPEGHSPPPPALSSGSPKPILRKKNKPAPTPPTQIQNNSKSNKNPLANSFNAVKPFSGSYAPASASPSGAGSNRTGSGAATATKSIEGNKLLSKEKREGVWIPPSPKDTQGRRRLGLDGQGQNVPPVKPPPPVSYNPGGVATAGIGTEPNSMMPSSVKQKFMESTPAGPPPKPESPLRYKSSFNKGNSVESSTTDNIQPKGGGGPGIGGNSSFGNQAANFASLPRHFHSENSYKNQTGKATPPARPPSMFGIPPPAPPITTVATTTLATSEAPVIGFERMESDIRKESLTSSDLKPNSAKEAEADQGHGGMGPPPASLRPIPAPRSSLLSQSHSFKDTTTSSSTNSGGESGTGTPPSRPEVRERPSIMAKPRDLSRRNLSSNSNPDENTSSFPSHSNTADKENHSGGSGGSGSEEDHPKNNVLESPTGVGGLYPNLSHPHRPPRPQPPAPTQQNQNSTPNKPKVGQESTDL